MKGKLIKEAERVRMRAHVPYSNFAVGAAVLTKNGNIFTGCNIENAAYPATCCAERVAMFNAIANGESKFDQLAVIADTKRPVPPCGICRQVMSEFFDEDVQIHLANLHGEIKTISMGKLLPFAFVSEDMDV
ncbi:cytidine deaminase [Virgibacillus sp. W0181]|uniref:cytidine deaminase n=1 Tax=Virgibacillus sp. W0181 TaxID=3391581 RepID=UPI003F46A77B